MPLIKWDFIAFVFRFVRVVIGQIIIGIRYLFALQISQNNFPLNFHEITHK